MLDTIKKLLGFGSKVDYAELIKRGAIILDVRSKSEFAGGHVKGSINIPLDTLSEQLAKLKKDKPVITCCASGMRSAGAKSILKQNGFTEVYNGGSWVKLTHLSK
jgi:rhodanese-related sulfurtransferase